MKEARNRFFCIVVFLYTIICSLSVPVFNGVSDAEAVRFSKETCTIRSEQYHSGELFAALEIQPIKIIINAGKRFIANFFVCCPVVATVVCCSFCVFTPVKKSFLLLKNKYLKSVIFLQTLL